MRIAGGAAGRAIPVRLQPGGRVFPGDFHHRIRQGRGVPHWPQFLQIAGVHGISGQHPEPVRECVRGADLERGVRRRDPGGECEGHRAGQTGPDQDYVPDGEG